MANSESDEIAEFVITKIGVILAGADTWSIEAEQARKDLNVAINSILLNSYRISSEAISMWLRTTVRVKHLLRNWDLLFIEAQKLFKERHGQEHTNNLLFGLHLNPIVI